MLRQNGQEPNGARARALIKLRALCGAARSYNWGSYVAWRMKGVRKDVSLPLQPRVQAESSLKGGNVSPELQPAKPPRPRVTFMLVVTVAAAVLGSTSQFGFNIGVLNGPQQVWLSCFKNIINLWFQYFTMLLFLPYFFLSLPLSRLSSILLARMALAQCLLSSLSWRWVLLCQYLPLEGRWVSWQLVYWLMLWEGKGDVKTNNWRQRGKEVVESQDRAWEREREGKSWFILTIFAAGSTQFY